MHSPLSMLSTIPISFSYISLDTFITDLPGCIAGQKLLDSLADTWDFFFCDVLSMLQAIFYPVQVHILANKYSN